MREFEIQNVAIALGNSGPLSRPTLAEAHVVTSERRSRVFVLPDGQVHIPDFVMEVSLRHAVAIELRRCVMAHLTEVILTSDMAGAGRCAASDAAVIAHRLGLERSAGSREWRGRCPACGYSNSFMLKERRTRILVWCASCQDQNTVWSRVRNASGGVQHLVQGSGNEERADPAARSASIAAALWRSALPCPGTIAAAYLSGRGLPALAASAALRYRSTTRHPSGVTLPAMVAQIVDTAGAPMAVHRTFLRSDAIEQASNYPPKASLGPTAGGVIRLQPATSKLVVAEGIETAASAGLIFGLPAWSAISAGNLGHHLQLPHLVREIVIAADADLPGEAAAVAAAARWRREGRVVQIARPNRAGTDFNDILMARLNGS